MNFNGILDLEFGEMLNRINGAVEEKKFPHCACLITICCCAGNFLSQIKSFSLNTLLFHQII